MVNKPLNIVTIFSLITIKLIGFNLVVFNNEFANDRINLFASASENNFQLIDGEYRLLKTFLGFHWKLSSKKTFYCKKPFAMLLWFR